MAPSVAVFVAAETGRNASKKLDDSQSYTAAQHSSKARRLTGKTLGYTVN